MHAPQHLGITESNQTLTVSRLTSKAHYCVDTRHGHAADDRHVQSRAGAESNAAGASPVGI